MIERTKLLSRRNFLLTVGAGSTATAVAITAKKVPQVAPTSGQSKRTTRGYHVSAHVSNYYRTTQV
jgi:hypothetical protein